MRLQNLLQTYEDISASQEIWQQNIDISNIAYDSRKVTKGTAFFAITGHQEDGKRYIPDAVQSGAAVVIVESLSSIDSQYHPLCLVVKNIREALAIASCNFFSNPSKKMVLLAITGTKGKSSCAFLMSSILKEAGHTVAIMGTIECSYPGFREVPERTTSESYEIQKFLHNALRAGVTAAVIEVSAHALSLFRVKGCAFDGVLFTNLSEDHMDYYKNMETYFQAKKKLFTEFTTEHTGKKIVGVTNIEDSFGKRLLSEAKVPITSFGISSGDVRVLSKTDGGRIDIEVELGDGGKQKITSDLANTQFSIANILACIALSHSLQIPLQGIQKGIQKLKQIPGRLNKVETTLGFEVFIDFAHNGLALQSVLQALKENCKGSLMIVVGAGGEKDPSRRVGIGKAAADWADISIITSDNPRGEDPKKIIAAIVSAWENQVQEKKYALSKKVLHIEEDRRLAIRYALTLAKKGDVICIAGKGHERGQIIGKVIHPFDDAVVAGEELRKIENVRN